MVKKEPKSKKQLKLNIPFRAMGSAFKDVAVGAASHPVTAALFVMGGTVLLQFVTGAFSDTERAKHPNLRNVHGQLNGLYDGAQKIAAASASVPMAIAAFQTIAGVASARGKGGE
jgi:hypothetical protein